MMNWLKISENLDVSIRRGALIKFPSSHPFETQVVMMICESPSDSSRYGLMTITGHKAGFNCYSVFPHNIYEDGSLKVERIYTNWKNWVWPEGSPDEAWILLEGLSAVDLQ